jgi:hypothetical protein
VLPTGRVLPELDPTKPAKWSPFTPALTCRLYFRRHMGFFEDSGCLRQGNRELGRRRSRHRLSLYPFSAAARDAREYRGVPWRVVSSVPSSEATPLASRTPGPPTLALLQGETCSSRHIDSKMRAALNDWGKCVLQTRPCPPMSVCGTRHSQKRTWQGRTSSSNRAISHFLAHS